MKHSIFLCYTLTIVLILCTSTHLCPQTVTAEQITLPEGAKARLGKGSINAIAYSPDGTRLAVSSSLGIWMYDTHSGEELGLFTARNLQPGMHAASVSIGDIAYSPDGNTLASGGYDHAIRLWDAATGQIKATFPEHESRVTCIAFSPDGRTLASGGGYDDKTIRLWDVATREQKAVLTGHQAHVYALAFSPDGNILASGGGYKDETVRLWDVNKEQQIAALTGHRSSIQALAFSADSHTLASGSYDDFIRLWDVNSGQRKKLLTGHRSKVSSLIFSPDGSTLASGADDGYVLLWDTVNWTQKSSLWHPDDISDIAFSPNGSTLAIASTTEVQLWDVVKGIPKKQLTKRPNTPLSAAFSPDGQTLACGSQNGTVQFWNIDKQQLATQLPPPPVLRYKSWGWHPWSVLSVAFSPDGKMLATVGNTQIYLWECLSDGAEYKAKINSVRVDRIWCQKAILMGHKQDVANIAFSPDGSLIASGSWDNTIKLFNAESGQYKTTFIGHTQSVKSVAFSPDGQTLASGSNDGTARLWDTATGTEKTTLIGHNPWVTGVAFSPDGRTLASSGGWRDKSIRLWDAHSGKHKRTFIHTDEIRSVAFSPDGRILAGGSWDGTVLLWGVHTEALKRTLAGHTSSVNSIVFSPDGNTLASISYDGTVLLWNLDGMIETVQSAPVVNNSEREMRTLKQTALLPNYPNPFNPETWIPYQLANPADVTVRIYTANGILIRTLLLGHQLAGSYQNPSRAAYWNGKNEVGEQVASGVYFYTLSAGETSMTRKMLIRK